MPYVAEISRARPGCIIFMIDQSGSMNDSMAGAEPGKKKADAVADAINRLLQNLVIKCSKGEGIRDYFHVGVLGYGAYVGSAYGGGLAGGGLVKTSELANNPLRVEERLKKNDDGAGGVVEQKVKFPVWFDPVAQGNTPGCRALGMVREMLSKWIAHYGTSYPPIVINITDGEFTDGNPLPLAAEIHKLSTSDGNVLLYNCHICAKGGPKIVYPNTNRDLPDEPARKLFQMTSALPGMVQVAAKAEGLNLEPGARGFALNAELVDMIRFLDIGTRLGIDLR